MDVRPTTRNWPDSLHGVHLVWRGLNKGDETGDSGGANKGPCNIFACGYRCRIPFCPRIFDLLQRLHINIMSYAGGGFAHAVYYTVQQGFLDASFRWLRSGGASCVFPHQRRVTLRQACDTCQRKPCRPTFVSLRQLESLLLQWQIRWTPRRQHPMHGAFLPPPRRIPQHPLLLLHGQTTSISKVSKVNPSSPRAS